MAGKTIKTNRRLARTRATIDIILKTEDEPHYQEIKAIYLEVRDGPGLATINDAKTHAAHRERQAVQSFLSHYELMSIGISKQILDEHIYHEWKRQQLVSHWNDAKELIFAARARTNNERILNNFEKMATAWESGKFITNHHADKE
ncbi:MAG: DUF4760 domain-containing protein [Motiliproteus sp.]|nr:DUF4760 domain-containing protein [Motiliproteus sp.]MCW9051261.1 DUF4760 domain-containing protein [Motiliproteus sp.]